MGTTEHPTPVAGATAARAATFFGRAASFFLSALLLCGFLPSGALAQSPGNTYSIYVDADNDAGTGCSAPLENNTGPYTHAGAEYRIDVTVGDTVGPVTLSACSAGSFGSPNVVDGSLRTLAVTPSSPSGYVDNIELGVPLHLLGGGHTMALALASSGDYMVAKGGGPAGPGSPGGPIVFVPYGPLGAAGAQAIPVVPPFAFLALALLMAAAVWRMGRTYSHHGKTLLICLLAMGCVTLSLAATFININDGSVTDWAGQSPLASQGGGHNVSGQPAVLALYAHTQGDTLYFRIDADSARAQDPNANNPGGDPGGNPPAITFSTTAAQYLQAGQPWSLSLGATAQAAGPVALALIPTAQTPAALQATGGNPLGLQWTPSPADTGTHLITIQATDAEGNTQTRQLLLAVASNAPLPVDPSTVAPPLGTGITPFAESTAFLYTGANPIQQGVAAGAIDEERAAVIRGLVTNRAGQPLAGVNVQILGHPEYGHTTSRADGWFDLAVNGGGLLVVEYTRPGYLKAQRKVDVPWRDWAIAENVALLTLDDKATTIALEHDTWQAASGTPTSDARGQRTATVLIPAHTQATLQFADGSTQPLQSLTLRATEFTVGDNGPDAMPGELPISVNYTYAVELSADEAIAAGAHSVQLSQPVLLYVDDFINAPVGTAVPLGWYDYARAAWIGDENGRVIKILSIDNGQAVLQVTEDARAATDAELAGLGITAEELEQLAMRYGAGKVLWRSAISHLTPWDCNWPYGPDDDDDPPPPPPPPPPECKDGADCCPSAGCDVFPNRQLGQGIEIPGSPYGLYYRSAEGSNKQTIQLISREKEVSPRLREISVAIEVAGVRFRVWQGTGPFTPGMQYNFEWDGKDAYGRDVPSANVRICQSNSYPAVYYASPADFTAAFASATSRYTGSDGAAASSLSFGSNAYQMLYDMTVCWSVSFYAPQSIPDILLSNAGGWALTGLKGYDVSKKELYTGGGTTKTVERVGWEFKRFANMGGYVEDLSIAADGSLLSAVGNRIVRVHRDGSQTIVAGTGEYGFSGDGGPATEARLDGPNQLTQGLDGSVYFLDQRGDSIRKMDPAGTITTIAGKKPDDTSSTPLNADLLTVDRDGNLYFVRDAGDGYYSKALEQITAAGNMHTVELFYYRITALAANPAGGLWIAIEGRILQISPGGTMTAIAGGGTEGGGGNALMQRLVRVTALQSDHADGFYYFDIGNSSDYKHGHYSAGITTVAASDSASPWVVAPDGETYRRNISTIEVKRTGLPGYDPTYIIARDEGVLLDRFDKYGRPVDVRNSLTDVVMLTYQYDANGYPISATDINGNVVTFERDAEGRLTAIVGINGERSVLTYNAQNRLASVTVPGGATHAMEYEATRPELLTAYVDPNGHIDTFTYDSKGRLATNTNPAGGGWTLSTEESTEGGVAYTTQTLTSVLGRATKYKSPFYNASNAQIVTMPDGLSSTWASSGSNGYNKSLPDGSAISGNKYPDTRYGMVAGTNVQTWQFGTGGNLFPISLRTQTTRNYNDQTGTWSETRTIGNPYSITGSSAAYKTEYDGWGTISYTTPVGLAWRAHVDEQLRPTYVIPTGQTALNYEYDTRGRLSKLTSTGDAGNESQTRTSTTTYHTDAPGKGQLASITNALGQSVSFAYDAAGRIHTSTLPDGRTLQYTYDANGNQLSLKTPAGVEHYFAYNAINQPTGYNAPASATTWTYNLDRELTAITRPGGQSITLGYDMGGRIAQMGTPQGTTTWTYNAVGQLKRISGNDAILHVSRTGTLPTGVAWSGAIQGSVQTELNLDQRLLPQSVTVEAGGEIVKLNKSFDAANRITSVLAGDSLDYTKMISLGYGSNMALSAVKAAGLSTRLQYNDFAEVTEIEHTNYTSLFSQQTQAMQSAILGKVDILQAALNAEIDRLGNCNRKGWYVFEPILQSAPIQTPHAKQDGENNNPWRYESDLSAEEIAQYTEKFGPAMVRTPSVCVQWVENTIRNLRNSVEANLVNEAIVTLDTLQTTASGGAAAITIVMSDLPALSDSTSYITPTAAALIAEMRSQLADYAANVYDQSYLAHFAYQYDALGRITQQTQNILGAGDVVQQYTYDEAGRLTKATRRLQETTWGYDANGNRTHQNGSTIATYDSEDRLQSWKGNTYTYNAAGDLQSKATTAGTTSYQYDALGNLRSVILENGDQINYLIDPANRRIGKKKNDALQYGLLYQDSLRPIAQLKPDGSIKAVFIYAEKPNVPSAMLMDGDFYRIISDHLGSVRLVINASTNTIVQQMDYDVWGNVTNDTNPEFQPFGFAGGLYDRDTGLTRFGARDYDAETGRWTAKDPILFDGGDSNLYGYVFNDPVNFIDPEGEIAFVPILVGMAIGYAFDYIVDKIKKANCGECEKDSNTSTVADTVLGGVIGATGSFDRKPRTGIAGGGPSGNKTSPFSSALLKLKQRGKISTGTTHALRNAGKQVAKNIPYVSGAYAAYQLYDAFECD